MILVTRLMTLLLLFISGDGSTTSLTLHRTYSYDSIEPPPIEDMCLHVTSYDVWDENGDIYDGYHGQCDADCSKTGGGYTLPDRAEDYRGGYAACIRGWTSLVGYQTTHIKVNGLTVACVDSFGRESYQQPFFHPGYSPAQWVIPVDVLSAVPTQELVCNWSTFYDYAVDEYREIGVAAAN